MFDLGWSEMLIIAIVVIVVVGPKDLPKLLRTFGRTTSKMRSMAGEFRKQFDDAMKEAELDELKTLANDARKLNPAGELRKALSPLERAGKEIKTDLDNAAKPAKAPPPQAPSETPRPAAPLKTAPTAVASSKPAEAAAARSPAKPRKPAARAAEVAGPAAQKKKPAAKKAPRKAPARKAPARKAPAKDDTK